MKDIENLIAEKVIESINVDLYQKEIDKAVKEYFKSDWFEETFSEALNDVGLGYATGEAVGKKLIPQIKKIKVMID